MLHLLVEFSIFIFELLLIYGYCFAAPCKGDEINVILEELKNGQATGNYLHLDIVIYANDNGTSFSARQEWFEADDDKKMTTVSLEDSVSYDNSNSQNMKHVKWIPGKEFRCDYNALGGSSVELIAKKSGVREYDPWQVDGTGIKNMTEWDKGVKWELRSTRQVKLKYSELKLENLFWP